MSEYMLIVHDDLKSYSKFSQDELNEVISKMGNWASQLRQAGVHRGAAKLSDDSGKFVSFKGGAIVTDGPFAEAKEVIGGAFFVEVENEAQALSIARECPALKFGSKIEVRLVDNDCNSILKRAQTN
jgi:hypothetical protein